MSTRVQCPYCGSYNTAKTANGKATNILAKAGSVVGGALLEMATGVPAILSANIGIGRSWHQYCCHDCHEAFKVRLSAVGTVKEIKKY
jgi:transposase-like protein